MPVWLTAVILLIFIIVITGWALSHILWIALGAVGGWFLKEGVDWLQEHVR